MIMMKKKLERIFFSLPTDGEQIQKFDFGEIKKHFDSNSFYSFLLKKKKKKQDKNKKNDDQRIRKKTETNKN